MELNSCVCGMKILFNLNQIWNEKLQLFSQETYDFEISRSEALIIAGCEDIKISIFHWLTVKLWLEDNDDLQTDNH